MERTLKNILDSIQMLNYSNDNFAIKVHITIKYECWKYNEQEVASTEFDAYDYSDFMEQVGQITCVNHLKDIYELLYKLDNDDVYFISKYGETIHCANGKFIIGIDIQRVGNQNGNTWRIIR